MEPVKFNPISLNGVFMIKKINKKTQSSAFKEFKEGDSFLVALNFNSPDVIYVWKVTNSGLDFKGTCILAVLNRLMTHNYDLDPLKSVRRDLVKDYCKNYCLTEGDPNVCKICPLKNFK